jgi:hypothetical protein
MSFPDLAKAQSALQRVFPIIDRKPEIDSSSAEGDAPDSRSVTGTLELQHVVFAYPARPEVKVFNNFCLKIPSGVALGFEAQVSVCCVPSMHGPCNLVQVLAPVYLQCILDLISDSSNSTLQVS